MSTTWTIHSLDDLRPVADAFLHAVDGHPVIAFHGPMGVGKTTFIKAIADVLGVQDDVNSPTFAIVNEYRTADNRPLFHFDLYRVNTLAEALDFGCEEYLYSGYTCLIEWPDLIAPILPPDTLHVTLALLPDGSHLLSLP